MPPFLAFRSPSSFDGGIFSFGQLRQRGQADLNGDTQKAGELPRNVKPHHKLPVAAQSGALDRLQVVVAQL